MGLRHEWHLHACYTCQFSGTCNPRPTGQNLRGWDPAIRVPTSPPGDSDTSGRAWSAALEGILQAHIPYKHALIAWNVFSRSCALEAAWCNAVTLNLAEHENLFFFFLNKCQFLDPILKDGMRRSRVRPSTLCFSLKWFSSAARIGSQCYLAAQVSAPFLSGSERDSSRVCRPYCLTTTQLCSWRVKAAREDV